MSRMSNASSLGLLEAFEFVGCELRADSEAQSFVILLA